MNNGSFFVCDARDLGMFKDNSFDFILFSFNGIDYVSHRDRKQIYKEVLRVTKSGGHFCFSSHNLNSFRKDTYKFKTNLLKMHPGGIIRKYLKRIKPLIKEILPQKKIDSITFAINNTIPSRKLDDYSTEISLTTWIKIRLHNKRKLLKTKYAIVNDGAHDFGLKTYYITPDEQINQLSSLFCNIKVYDLKKGKTIDNRLELNNNIDPWLYYLCDIMK